MTSTFPHIAIEVYESSKITFLACSLVVQICEWLQFCLKEV